MRLQTQIMLIAISMLILSISNFIVAFQNLSRYKQQSLQFKAINKFQKNQQEFNTQVVENLKLKQEEIGYLTRIVDISYLKE